jgi:hypothetical protein
MDVSWVVVPCGLVEVYRLAEVLAASIIRAIIITLIKIKLCLIKSYNKI